MSENQAVEKVEYFALLMGDDSSHAPSGLARRRYFGGGFVEETFRRDLSWQRSSVVWKWERGELGYDVVEIDEEDAQRVISRFTEKWSAADAQG